jgi:hypothetical protein
MRMQMRRFTRLTNAFSKKFDNHMHMVALYTVWYNYVKQHKSLKGLSPAVAAGISPTLWSMTDLAEMIDASLSKPGPRGPYEKADGRMRKYHQGLEGRIVQVIDGPFTGFRGEVKEVDEQTVKVDVQAYGRVTPLDLALRQIELVPEHSN